LEGHYRVSKRFAEYRSDWYRPSRGGEYLLRFHARVVNDCIFEKDYLKVVNTRDAAFTETLRPPSNISFPKSPLSRSTSIGLSKLVRSVQGNQRYSYTILEGIHWFPEHIGALCA
jgi:hypothetical protein